MFKTIFNTLFAILISVQTFAGGDLFYKNYYRKDYSNAHQQNWQIIEDDRGIIYIANDNLVLEFDGINWKQIKFTNENKCRSLHKSSSGKIYVGGYNDIGFLTTDKYGNTVLESITKGFNNKDFGRVDFIASVDSTIIFMSERSLLYYNENNNEVIKTIDLSNKGLTLLRVDDKILFSDYSDNILYIISNYVYSNIMKLCI